MFKSKARPIVVPQSEHARLSGFLASLWGNDQFDRPAMDFQSFVKGVTFHDRGYGLVDDNPINEMSSEIWLAIQREGIVNGSDDPIANVVSLMHIRRLLGYSNAAENLPLIELAEQHIQQSLDQTDLLLGVFEWADKITRWCDNVAFDFSFEEKTHDTSAVCPQQGSSETVGIDFHLSAGGAIHVQPWPFSVDHYTGFIIGYELAGYPERLEPVLMQFSLVRDTEEQTG